MKKDYLNGIHVRYITMDRKNTNSNTVVVFDRNFNVLFKEKFSSADIEDRKFHEFRFKESKKVGRGNKISVCFISPDGDSTNCIHSLFNKESKLGDLYACAMVNDDLVASVSGKKYPYPGAIFLRSYESDSSLSAFVRNLLYFSAFLVALAIIFFSTIERFLAKTRIHPEYVYLALAPVFGLLFVFFTPPMQVPDEGAHMQRILELSELQFTGDHKTVPAACMMVDSVFLRLHANPDERTSLTEIRSAAIIKADPGKRLISSGPGYTVPYIPQLLGLVTGKLFTSSVVFLMYFGRLFNLLCSIILVWFAIRTTPVAKWIFLLLALMPKSLFLMASLSYDAFVISSSFLLTALFLFYAFRPEKPLTWKNTGLLLLLWILLAMCKPPYFILGGLFFIIPFGKIKSLSKYLLTASVTMILVMVAFGIWRLSTGMVTPEKSPGTEQVAGQPTPAKTTAATVAPPEINPAKQVHYIMTHIPAFISLLVKTNTDHMRADMLNNFVGTMGWLDTFLPDTLINLYLLLLLITALCMGEKAIHPGWQRKLFFLALFLTGALAIESAMYIYSSFVAQEKLFGIQGRYFIPLAPLLLLLLYNNFTAGKLNYLFSTRRSFYLKSKPAIKSKILLEIEQEQIFTKYLQVFITGFAFLTLARGIAAVLLRYYQW